jgi:histidine phosphotransfer protein HptB
MIDWQRVQDLLEEVGEEDFGIIAALFLDEVEGVLDHLRITSDPGAVATDFHFLKGSAANLGFTALGDFCTKGEVMAKNGNADSIDVSGIFDIYARSKAEFATKIGAL